MHEEIKVVSEKTREYVEKVRTIRKMHISVEYNGQYHLLGQFIFSVLS